MTKTNGRKAPATRGVKLDAKSNGQPKEVTIKQEDPSDFEDQPVRRRPKKKIIMDSEGSESDVPIAKRVAKNTKPTANSASAKDKKAPASSSKQKILPVKKEQVPVYVIYLTQPFLQFFFFSPKKNTLSNFPLLLFMLQIGGGR